MKQNEEFELGYTSGLCAHSSCALDNPTGFLESGSGKNIYKNIYGPIMLNNFLVMKFVNPLQAFCICHQLKRELGVLKASYLQIASLVGGEKKVRKELFSMQKVIVATMLDNVS